jgi:ATP-dependent DNA helicase RecQ
MTDLDGALKKHFGFPSFRPNQRDIVEAILAGRDVFAALPTGGGKSLCYQLPAVIREGLTVVVSPLIALMKDQVDGAREDGIAAAYLNSTLSQDGAREVWRELTAGRTRLLYVSPERLSVDSFRAALLRLAPSFFAVDEAHCISEWGHEFRPDYRALGLLRNEFPEVPIAAFTATATAEVQADVVRQLGLRTPFIVRASFDRPEIFYRVGPRAGDGDEQIAAFIAARPGQSGIVYRGSRKQVESTAAFLAARGVSAAPYHAGMEDTERHARQEAFVKDELAVVVATIAFGMGIDKSNVRWIVHGDLPRSLEGYYQETGRAARDGEPADTLLLYAPRDIAAARWHIGKMESSEEQERAETRLREILRYAESGVCRRTTLLAHFGEAHPGACGRCDVCAGEIELVDLTVAAQKVLSAAARTGERFGAHHLADILVGNATDKVMERGHQALPTFGAGRDQDREWCRRWVSHARRGKDIGLQHLTERSTRARRQGELRRLPSPHGQGGRSARLRWWGRRRQSPGPGAGILGSGRRRGALSLPEAGAEAHRPVAPGAALCCLQRQEPAGNGTEQAFRRNGLPPLSRCRRAQAGGVRPRFHGSHQVIRRIGGMWTRRVLSAATFRPGRRARLA